MTPGRAPASFRDPQSSVFLADRRIWRGLRAEAAEGYRRLRQAGLLAALIAEGRMVASREAAAGEAGDLHARYDIVLEHELVEPITYPYEWSFSALQQAALLHLDIQLRCLDAGATLCDASAYNIQFRGPRPLLLDVGSFRPYRPGELWLAHDQLLRQFLGPLLLTSATGTPFQRLLRGFPEGLPVEELARLLPWRSKLAPRTLIHIVLPAALQRRASPRLEKAAAQQIRSRSLPPARLRALLQQLRSWIDGLALPRRGGGWVDYEANTSYSENARTQKRDFVAGFIRRTTPARLLDVGCNTGEYSALALASGAGSVVGLESDGEALDAAYRRADSEGLACLPLFQDLTDPSPAMGWRLVERAPLAERVHADAVLALAVLHHLVIARNLPMAEVVEEIVRLARCGIIEFVQKSDPMVQRLLALREDLFPDYHAQAFEQSLERVARITQRTVLEGDSRILYAFERR